MSSYRTSMKKMLHVNRPLIPLKIFVIMYSFGTNSFYPYLSLHLRQVGLTMGEIGYINSVWPFIAMFGPPLLGFVADKIGNYKYMFIGLLSIGIILYGSMLFLPYIEIIHQSINVSVSPINTSLVAIDIPKCGELCSESWINTSLTVNYSCGEAPSTQSMLLQNLDNQTSEGCIWYASAAWNNSSLNSSCLEIANTTCSETRGNHYIVFWSNFVLRVATSIVMSGCFGLVDATILTMIKHHKGEYGKQRMWGAIPQLTAPPIVGVLIDTFSYTYAGSDVWPIIILFIFFELVALIFYSLMDLKVELQAQNILKNLTRTFINAETLLLFTACLMMGSINGFLSTFLSLYQYNIGASKFLIGLSRTIGGAAGFPVLFFADGVVRKFGSTNILVFVFVIHMIRMVMYSIISNPYWSLLLEALRAFTNSLQWVAIVTYGAAITPKGLLATVQGTIRTVYHGCGRGLGALIGGLLMSSFGERIAFRSLGLASGIVAVLYFMAFHLIIRRRKLRQPSDVNEEMAKTEEELRPWVQEIVSTE